MIADEYHIITRRSTVYCRDVEGAKVHRYAADDGTTMAPHERLTTIREGTREPVRVTTRDSRNAERMVGGEGSTVAKTLTWSEIEAAEDAGP